MKVNLYIKYEDLEKYQKGHVIDASTEKNKSHIFDRPYDVETINVLVDAKEIIEQKIKKLNGMIKGDFAYYTIVRSRNE